MGTMPRDFQLLVYDVGDARTRLMTAAQRAEEVYAQLTREEVDGLEESIRILTALERSLKNAETQFTLPLEPPTEGWKPSPYLVGKASRAGRSNDRDPDEVGPAR